MAAVRRPLLGVGNILRFNWHFYVLAAGAVAVLVGAGAWLGGLPRVLALAAAGAVVLTTGLSLAVSCWVYDLSGLYEMRWLDGVEVPPGGRMANIHAGFDETSAALRQRYPGRELVVMDFYDPARHTEVSIRRARRAYPPSPEDLRVDTSRLPADTASMHAVFAILAAHEIRDGGERRAFFAELRRILAPGGRIVVLEHLRDLNNLLAYNLGAFHFHSRRTWLEAFAAAGLRVAETFAVNPFITCFVLESDAAAA